MSNWEKEPDSNWLIDLHRRVVTPKLCSGNINKKTGEIKPNGALWEGPYYSDYGDDRILEYLFKYINKTTKFAVDIGASSGYGGSNVRFLVDTYDWGSTELDYSSKWTRIHPRVNKYRDVKTNQLRPEIAIQFAKKRKITRDNVCQVLNQYRTPKIFDLLSLDIDSMDWYVLKSLLNCGFNPSVAIVEYNPIFNHDESYVKCYSEKFWKNDTSGYGASLRAFEKLFNKHNYTLVGNVADIGNKIYSNNAIFLNNKFIRDDDVVQTIKELHPRAWVEYWKTGNDSDDLYEVKSKLIENGTMESKTNNDL